MGYQLAKNEIARAVGGHSYGNGHQMQARGLVRSVEVSADGLSVVASVLSSGTDGRHRKPYSQTISLSWIGRRLSVQGYCTCPVGRNCKHVAAALIELVGRNGGIVPGSPVAGGEPEPRPRRERVVPGPGFTTQPVATAPRSRRAVEQPTLFGDGPDGAGGWLARVTAAAAAAASGPAAAAHHTPGQSGSLRQMLFILNPRFLVRAAADTVCVIRPLSVRIGSDGSYSDARPYPLDHGLKPKEHRPRYVTDRDAAIVDDLHWLQRAGGRSPTEDVALPASAASRYVLEAMLATGRLHHGDIDGPVLTAGDPVPGIAVWRRLEMQQQQLWFAPDVPPASAAPDPLAAGNTAADAAPAHNGPRFDALLPLSVPFYVDLAAARVGPIVTSLPPHLAHEVACAPVIAASDAAHVTATLQSAQASLPVPEPGADGRVPQTVLPLPEIAAEVEIREVVPVPLLEMTQLPVRVKPGFGYLVEDVRHSEEFALPVARLAFDYDGHVVPSHGDHPMTIERLEDGKLIVVRRRLADEAAARQRLEGMGLAPLDRHKFLQSALPVGGLYHLSPADAAQEPLAGIDDPSPQIAFSAEGLPELVREGWRITYAADYPYQVAAGAAEWWADVGEGSGIDWFSFELGITFEGHRINLVPMLADVLAGLPDAFLEQASQPGGEALLQQLLARTKLYHTLPDGRLLPLPGERLAPALQGLLELIGPRHGSLDDGELRLHRAEAPALAAFAARTGAEVAWAASTERLISLGRSLVAGRPPEPVAPPTAFKAALRPYQGDGLSWLEFLRQSGFGGVLADDMGLGKTVQALAFLSREKAEGRLGRPALIVAPTSVLPNWQAEAARFAPELKVLALRGADRHELFGEVAASDLVLTTYPLLARDQATLLANEFHVAILDEAQAIKNPKAAISQVAHQIKAQHRLALTGTPLENNLGEVWSLFEFLAPGLLGDATTFRRVFRTPIEKHGCMAAQAFLSRRLKPFMLRRTKEEVATELPPKTVITERVRLEGGQRDLYETVRALMAKKVRDEIAKKGLAKSHIIFLDALLKLRQVCCDPRLLKMPQARRVKESAKLERLLEMLPELVGEGRRILLFSQFTSMLALIEDELAALRIPYVKLTGDTDDRAEPVRRFQAGEVPLFLLSLKAGGTGLNLTAADTVIHYDPWWNPAVENQATDRAYRIGQQKPVFVYKLIVEEGIEEAIELLKARKAALADALFAGGSKAPLELTEADIGALFAPLSPTRSRERQAA